jgi:hypothetical protein
MRTHLKAALPSALSYLVALAGKEARQASVAAAALLTLTFAAPPAHAQDAIVQKGYAVVTGYSGFVANPAPDGADAFDYLTINPDGPSARVVDLTAPGPQGSLSPAPKPFSVSAAQVGQVFGVTLDNAALPNIYVAATSAYGLSIFTPDSDGNPQRIHKGAPGAQFVPGQFGHPELGGGPNSVWKIDGGTGEVTLFSTVDTGTGSLAGLGGMAFDPVSKQIFVAERGTGIVYRMGLDGVVDGSYDHGVEGRPDAGLPPIAMPAAPAAVNIETPAFDTENPKTWGFAAPARRVFALAVHNKRLYYSVAQGPQIWSAAISGSGAVSNARLEVEIPALDDGIEVTSITFDGSGRMYVAERGPTAGDYFLYNLANGGQSRVLRYQPKAPGDPAPGLWTLVPEQYSVGLPPAYNNADGGVALNYGYNQAGQINTGACGATVWSTGERLLDPGDGSEGFDYVDGLQGNNISLVQPQNVPPTNSWFVDYDDQAGNPDFRGYMGAIATLPCAGAPPPPPVVCPQGTYFSNGQCLLFPTCPPGTNFLNGQCVYPQCPPGLIHQGDQCVPPPMTCPPGSVFYQGQCVPMNCPPGLQRLPNGYCACPPNTKYFDGQCVPPNACPPGTITLPGGICWCPLGLVLQNGKCKPFDCPPGQVFGIGGQCVPIECPPGLTLKNGVCVPIFCPPNKELFHGECVPKCPFGTVRQPNGSCKPLVLCIPPKEVVNGQCVNPCPLGTFRQPDGSCKPLTICLPPKQIFNGQCVNPCPPGTFRQPEGSCKPLVVFCIPPKQMINGQCLDPCPPGTFRQKDGTCKPLVVFCVPPKQMVNGQCVNPCPPGTFRQKDGSCKPLVVFCVPPKQMVNGQCLDPCPPGTFRQKNGSCKPLVINPGVLCLAPKQLVNGQCLDPCPPGTFRQKNGSCKPLVINPGVLCLAPKQMVNGQCLDPCPPGQIRQKNG